MFKNVKVLRKENNFKNKYTAPSIEQKLQSSRVIPLGVNEVYAYSSVAPIIISGSKIKEFALYCGLSASNNIFTKIDVLEEPQFIKNHPFLTIKVKNEKDEDVLVIGIDDDTNYIGEDKDLSIFDEKQNLNKEFEEKLQQAKQLEHLRTVSKEIISELEKYDLLQKQSFNIRVNGDIKPILEDYYIVNKEKLNKIDSEVLVLWAKKGWIGIIDAHIYSIRNFKKLVDLVK